MKLKMHIALPIISVMIGLACITFGLGKDNTHPIYKCFTKECVNSIEADTFCNSYLIFSGTFLIFFTFEIINNYNIELVW